MAALSTQPEVAAPRPPASSRRADAFMRRLLRVQPVHLRDQEATEAAAHRLFSTSILLSAARCLFTYLVLPIGIPIFDGSGTVSAAIGLPLSVVALVFDVRAVRRFWLADHRWRWAMTAIYAFVMALVVGLGVNDVIVLS